MLLDGGSPVNEKQIGRMTTRIDKPSDRQSNMFNTNDDTKIKGLELITEEPQHVEIEQTDA